MTGNFYPTGNTEKSTWEELANKAATGDREATNQLLTETRPWITNCVKLHLNGRTCSGISIEHIVQEVQLKLWQHASSREFTSVKGWLWKVIARKVARSIVKYRGHLPLTSTSPDGEEIYTHEPADKNGSPEEIALREERRAQVQKCISKLKENLQEALMCKSSEELTAEEAALALGLKSEATYKSRLAKARQLLKECLLRSGESGQ
jgi:RNA polymerase sigma factor (sigma-70 family)